jgi:hypothetical protein
MRGKNPLLFPLDMRKVLVALIELLSVNFVNAKRVL